MKLTDGFKSTSKNVKKLRKKERNKLIKKERRRKRVVAAKNNMKLEIRLCE